MIIHAKDYTIETDMINNTLFIYHKDGKQEEIQINNRDSNYSYTKMHQAIINNDLANVCSYKNGKEIVDIISNIECMDI